MTPVVKLSSPATSEFWEIPILHEDAELLALNKPSGLRVSPDRIEPALPSLMKLLHRDIERGALWARERSITYLINTHRLDAEASGVIVLAKTKRAVMDLASQFGSEPPASLFVALVRGTATESTFTCDAPLAAHPTRPGVFRVDKEDGKKSRTDFTVRETFSHFLLLECRPLIARPFQIRAHLKHLRLPVVGDETYGSATLLLSTLKDNYRLKPGHEEKPLIARSALHCEQITVRHPDSGQTIKFQAPWARDLNVALKYLRRYGVHATR